MHDNYSDIKERITEDPTWWDENGTPRYGEFTHERCPDIYANTVVLMQIACQDCGKRFQVQMASGWDNPHRLPPKKWHYGDPPRHGCAGDTMNCEDVAVLEVWQRGNMSNWERRSDLEGTVDGIQEADWRAQIELQQEDLCLQI